MPCCVLLPISVSFYAITKLFLVGLDYVYSMSSVDLRAIFDDFDANHDGFLTIEEICEWMNKSGFQLNKGRLSELVKICDWNGDGYLEFKEFATFNKFLEEYGVKASPNAPNIDDDDDDIDHDGEMREAFKVYDKDGNGFISPQELRAALLEIGMISSSMTSMKSIENMIESVDKDGDGQVNFSEFETMLKDKSDC